MLVEENNIENFSFYEFKFLKVKIHENYLEIILNRPDKKNALNPTMIKELAICTDYANPVSYTHLTLPTIYSV